MRSSSWKLYFISLFTFTLSHSLISENLTGYLQHDTPDTRDVFPLYMILHPAVVGLEVAGDVVKPLYLLVPPHDGGCQVEEHVRIRGLVASGPISPVERTNNFIKLILHVDNSV